MVLKTLSKIGHGNAVLIPRAMLDIIGVKDASTEWVMLTNGEALIARPVNPGRKTPPVGLGKPLVKVTNSYYMYIDAVIRALLGIEEGAELELLTDGKAIVIRQRRQSLTAERITADIEAVIGNAKELTSMKKAG